MMTKDGLIFEANSLKQGRLQALTRQQLQAQATQNRERRWGPSTFPRYQRAGGPGRSLRLCCTFPPKEGAVNNADFRGGVTCLYDTQLLDACLHASESGGRSRPEAVRDMPDVPIAPTSHGRAPVGSVSSR